MSERGSRVDLFLVADLVLVDALLLLLMRAASRRRAGGGQAGGRIPQSYMKITPKLWHRSCHLGGYVAKVFQEIWSCGMNFVILVPK